MNTTQRVFPFLALFLVLATATSALAWGPGSGKRSPRPDRGQTMPCILQDIPEERQAEFEKYLDQHRKNQFVLHQNLKALRAEMDALMVDPVSNQDRIQKNIDKAADMHGDLQKNRVRLQTRIFELTGESCVLDGCGRGFSSMRGPRPNKFRGAASFDGSNGRFGRGRGAPCWDR